VRTSCHFVDRVGVCGRSVAEAHSNGFATPVRTRCPRHRQGRCTGELHFISSPDDPSSQTYTHGLMRFQACPHARAAGLQTGRNQRRASYAPPERRSHCIDLPLAAELAGRGIRCLSQEKFQSINRFVKSAPQSLRVLSFRKLKVGSTQSPPRIVHRHRDGRGSGSSHTQPCPSARIRVACARVSPTP